MLSDSAALRLDPLTPVLHAAGPAPGHADELATFGRFVGAWDIVWSGLDARGAAACADGTLHVGWVLGGHAVQDVWAVPGAGTTGHAERGVSFYGTTVRFFDPDLGAWRSTWIDPVNGRVRRFVGRATADGVELVSLEGGTPLRWRFTDVAAASFTWIGEHSDDEARTWVEVERMHLTRRPDPADPDGAGQP